MARIPYMLAETAQNDSENGVGLLTLGSLKAMPAQAPATLSVKPVTMVLHREAHVAEEQIGRPNNGFDGETTANSTWSRMLAGNRRFAQNKAEHPWQDRQTRESLIDGQNPDAAVLSCSDSRVPPEVIFDQGLGDMFTVRTAGQVIDDGVLASLEFAVTSLHVSLIVILGHQNCGAVASAIKAVDGLTAQFGQSTPYTNVPNTQDALHRAIETSDSIFVRAVGSSVQQARDSDLSTNEDYERVHIARTIEDLVDRSAIISNALHEQLLMLVGARYQLTTGTVEVLSF